MKGRIVNAVSRTVYMVFGYPKFLQYYYNCTGTLLTACMWKFYCTLHKVPTSKKLKSSASVCTQHLVISNVSVKLFLVHSKDGHVMLHASSVRNAGGHSLKNLTLVCVALNTPFSCSHCHLQDPHFSIFQLWRPYFHPQITNFWKIYTPKSHKKLLLKPQIGPKFSSHGYILFRNSVY